MILRIQSLYLILVVLLSCIVIYLSLNSSFDTVLNSWFQAYYGFYSIPTLGFLSLFLFSKRKTQSIFCFVLILLNLVVVHIYSKMAFGGNSNFIILMIVVISFLECVLLFLARRAINKDEALVHSIDRIR